MHSTVSKWADGAAAGNSLDLVWQFSVLSANEIIQYGCLLAGSTHASSGSRASANERGVVRVAPLRRVGTEPNLFPLDSLDG
jgi:hypothetical protein